jgi:hypothetical protein
MPLGEARRTAENKLVVRSNDLDKALEGIEREEVVRSELSYEGGVSLGESDKEIMDKLGITSGPDFALIKGDTLLLAESKGQEVGDAIDQFAAAMNAPKLPPEVIHFDLRIYLKPDVWEALLKAEVPSVGGFPAKRVGESWYIMGQPKLRGVRVLLLP